MICSYKLENHKFIVESVALPAAVFVVSVFCTSFRFFVCGYSGTLQQSVLETTRTSVQCFRYVGLAAVVLIMCSHSGFQRLSHLRVVC